MGIIEGLSSGFLQAVSLDVFPYLFVGAVFGLVIGVIPGLSGHSQCVCLRCSVFNLIRCVCLLSFSVCL